MQSVLDSQDECQFIEWVVNHLISIDGRVKRCSSMNLNVPSDAKGIQ